VGLVQPILIDELMVVVVVVVEVDSSKTRLESKIFIFLYKLAYARALGIFKKKKINIVTVSSDIALDRAICISVFRVLQSMTCLLE
jgi:hypothetical protein